MKKVKCLAITVLSIAVLYGVFHVLVQYWGDILETTTETWHKKVGDLFGAIQKLQNKIANLSRCCHELLQKCEDLGETCRGSDNEGDEF